MFVVVNDVNRRHSNLKREEEAESVFILRVFRKEWNDSGRETALPRDVFQRSTLRLHAERAGSWTTRQVPPPATGGGRGVGPVDGADCREGQACLRNAQSVYAVLVSLWA